MPLSFDRRTLLTATGATLTSALVSSASAAEQSATNSAHPFGFCLNLSTIRQPDEKPYPFTKQIEVAAEAGYQGIEPWVGDVQKYVEEGGSLYDLRKRIADAGLTVESTIAFAAWLVDDEEQRAMGYEKAKREMELVQAIGGTRIAAPPAGVTQQADLNLMAAAERYRKLLEIGDVIGVVPELELWGFSKSLSRLGELMFVAIESGHPAACVLPDVYHIYKGGSDYNGLRLIEGSRIHVIHFNDYPAHPPRDQITDRDRIYPGDGVAPLTEILRTLRDTGSRCMLSLELFNREYWKQDPLTVARTGVEKIKAAVAAALA